jgi:hypothetical protein
MSPKVRWSGAVLGVLGLALVLVMHWQVFFWVSTERTMGVVQRIFYVHAPAASASGITVNFIIDDEPIVSAATPTPFMKALLEIFFFMTVPPSSSKRFANPLSQ